MYAQDSIDLLTNCGIQFKQHDEYGLDVSEFAELLMSSGVVLSEGVRWISFHRYSVIQSISPLLFSYSISSSKYLLHGTCP